ncbi:hypothetical protein [Streptomyces europaeiscabiei]|uniref:hypothetical protein n=1 Tax=Streptomyces europaeiscabiei TaxID=146819 RepID=UPI0029B1A6FB|nr:hypothetical protein [Streptomyces europaeiscabiei]MDX3841738.1 hypothetical protein [Streptomyces europaeiscabiei]
MYQVTTPVREFNGCVAGVWFVDGEATTDSEGAVAYFRRHGYTVTAEDGEQADGDPPGDPGTTEPDGPQATKPAGRPRSKG